jgi:small subunit ribosomal protein S6
MRRYETILILRPDLGESAQRDTIKRFEGIIAATSGDLVETDEWGFRELAYRIKGERRGYYVRLDYGGNGATMNEVERNLKLSDSVLRYLSVLVEAEADLEKVRADIEARNRRTAEARAATEARIATAAAAAAEREHAREHPPSAAAPGTVPSAPAIPEVAAPEAEEPEDSEETPEGAE